MKKVILGSVALCASLFANSLSDTIKSATIDGSATLFSLKNDKENNDDGFSVGILRLGATTEAYRGVSFDVGAIGYMKLGEENSGDHEAAIQTDSYMNRAAISLSTDNVSLKVGRQEIDLEWASDFHEAAVLAITPNDDLTAVLAYSRAKAVFNDDEASKKFESVNEGNGGAYIADVKYSINDIELNPYYYYANDLFTAYGAKAQFSTDNFGLLAHYASTSEKVDDKKDGNIMHLEASASVADINLAVGYIKTDKEGGIGTLEALGENIKPSEEGNQVYGTDAKTSYISGEYGFGDFTLTALYANSDYEESKEEVEVNLGAEYTINEELSAGIVYADIDANADTDDYKKYTLTVSYAF
jgi:hypothetical protein